MLPYSSCLFHILRQTENDTDKQRDRYRDTDRVTETARAKIKQRNRGRYGETRIVIYKYKERVSDCVTE